MNLRTYRTGNKKKYRFYKENISHKIKGTHPLMCFFFVFTIFITTIMPFIQGIPAFAEEPGLEVAAPAPSSLHAYSAVLYDGNAGRVLYEKNGYEVLPMASTTKIMTLLIVLEHTEPTDIVTVSQNAAKQPDVQLNMNTGEQYYVRDLCYSLMLESHNDTAVALAEHVGGSVEGFAALMNAKANALGAYSANFVTPNGLDAEGHGISAADLAKIATYAVKQEEFRKITNTASHTFTELTKGRSFTVSNKDAFLSMMDGAIGVKTGYTGKAGYCFVGALERDDRLFVSVVLASGWPPHKTYKWSDTRLLMNYGLEAFQTLPLIEDISALPELPSLTVKNGQKTEISLCYPEEKLKELTETRLLRTGEENVTYCVELNKNGLQAPVTAGEVVGELVIKLDGDCVKKIPVQTAEAVVPVDYLFCFKKTVKFFFSGEAFSTLRQLLP